MSDRLHSYRHLIARLVCAETLVPAGVAAAAGIAAALIVPPRWRAAGLPYLSGYGKNVESAAVAAALAAGASTQLFIRSRRVLMGCALLAGCGFLLFAARYSLVPLFAAWPQLALIAGLAAVLGLGRDERVPSVPATLGAPGVIAAALVTALAGAVFTFTVGSRPLRVDVFHHGEVLSTAVDLLHGGRPFETLLWPHGLHDTGLAALWIRATGKVGTSPIALAWVSCCALGIVSTYLLARRLLGSRFAALCACLAVALAPLLFDEPQAGAAARVLFQLGMAVFVALAFAAVTSPRRRYLAAGLCCGLAYLFRIETGVYGSLAALAVIAYRELAGAAGPAGGAAATALGGAILRFAAGAALALGGARLVLGWPGAAWFAYTLGDLPRYHRDAVGIPLPRPHRGVALSPGEVAWLQITLARLLLSLLLLVQALRAVLAPRRERAPGDSPWAARLLFVALFAALATKSGLDRSDPSHLLQWTALPLLAAACLAVTAWGDRRSWGVHRRGAAVFVLLPLLLVPELGPIPLPLPPLRDAAALAGAARDHWQGLVEHLRPNPPVGACADRMFTPGEARIDVNRRFIDDECAVEALLRSHGIGRMVIADAAPWYDVRFHLRPATRYFALARAYTPARQLEVIATLRSRPAQALLLPRGYNAIPDFDVPDALRVPVADAYLRARREGVTLTPTPLGDLFFWNEPAVHPPVTLAAGGGSPKVESRTQLGNPEVEIWTQLAAYQPASGLLIAKGWAAGATGPLAALRLRQPPPGVVASFEYGLGRDDAAAAGAWHQTGWELVCRHWRSLPAGFALALAGLTTGGVTVRVPLDLSAARRLGPLSGAEWDGLGAAVDRAAALGRADRAAALARVASAGKRQAGPAVIIASPIALPRSR